MLSTSVPFAYLIAQRQDSSDFSGIYPMHVHVLRCADNPVLRRIAAAIALLVFLALRDFLWVKAASF
jgi:hypothetical protein